MIHIWYTKAHIWYIYVYIIWVNWNPVRLFSGSAPDIYGNVSTKTAFQITDITNERWYTWALILSFSYSRIYNVFLLFSLEKCPLQKFPGKHGTFTQCCFNVWPPSSTLAQHRHNIGWMFHVCWVSGDCRCVVGLTCNRDCNACAHAPQTRCIVHCFKNIRAYKITGPWW